MIYAGIRPAIARRTRAEAAQTKASSTSLRSYVVASMRRSGAASGSRREQADTLGRQAQDRGNGDRGQVTQAAARLKVKIAQ